MKKISPEGGLQGKGTSTRRKSNHLNKSPSNLFGENSGKVQKGRGLIFTTAEGGWALFKVILGSGARGVKGIHLFRVPPPRKYLHTFQYSSVHSVYHIYNSNPLKPFGLYIL